MFAMESFLKDFEKGKAEGRYQAGSLPHLSFNNKDFGISLCSHFLFLYSEQLSDKFHMASIKELCRVAQEVRIFFKSYHAGFNYNGYDNKNLVLNIVRWLLHEID